MEVKNSGKCNIVFTIVQSSTDAWYLDSGCSRHVTGNRSFFSELKECTSGHVMLEDGAKGRILAKGNIEKYNLPCLNVVRYVEGLKANLISVNISESSPLSVHDENIVDSVAEGVETAPSVSETHISEMDSGKCDDVPLARFSSFDENFIPTPGHPPTTNVEVGQSGRSPPVRSSIRVDPLVDDQHSVPDPDPIGESIENLGENFDDPANQNLADVDAHIELTDTCAPDNVEPQPKTQQSPGESRPKGKKFQQNWQNITIKGWPFYPHLIKEFIVNVPSDFNNPRGEVVKIRAGVAVAGQYPEAVYVAVSVEVVQFRCYFEVCSGQYPEAVYFVVSIEVVQFRCCFEYWLQGIRHSNDSSGHKKLQKRMKILSKRFTYAFRGSLKSDIIEKDYSCIQGEPEV
ncbi:uncharacterized protein E5676_scaffold280G00670 [Cucumis melo var. makuwa]|uniref:Retrovirus-related Pol polyprotein from transposon TNT 1-94-like beta-barrel domain-containing protein n=1 Tax=Cucumis melo var. makuwa TaxID=1194695 RepID=A0A5D3BU81_CUCMM|nr:uncharacterized protein E6C27_scaffold243G001110 [Cucumis melo var. makuwa]TYK02655.1 uncharacterized protein E5676_scaffold280G00670 [Cucumis melo var. makuwa]